MSIFSEKLDAILKFRKIKQKDLATMLSMTPSAVNAYVKGTREPDFETVKKLCRILDVETNYFFNYATDNYFKNIYTIIDGQFEKTLDSMLNSIGLPKNIFYSFTNKQLKLTEKMLKNLAEIFNVSVDYLLDRTDTTVNETICSNQTAPLNNNEKVARILNVLNDINITKYEDFEIDIFIKNIKNTVDTIENLKGSHRKLTDEKHDGKSTN